jgi:hypothetical protein
MLPVANLGKNAKGLVPKHSNIIAPQKSNKTDITQLYFCPAILFIAKKTLWFADGQSQSGKW